MQTSPQTLRLYAGLLAQPGNDALEVLRELATEHPWLRQPLSELASLSLVEWQAEHTRLFISGHPKTLCPPYESAFVGGTMFGTACEQLGELYRNAGLQAEGMPADYLGTILECAAYLLEQPCEHSRELVDELWYEHLVSWLPDFSRVLHLESNLQFYRALASRLARLCCD